jgi:hypothetical protein
VSDKVQVKITSWRKHRRIKDQEFDATAVVSSNADGGVILIKREGDEAYMKITLSPSQFLELKAQLDHCAKRFQTE